jgi:hypothetical protein
MACRAGFIQTSEERIQKSVVSIENHLCPVLPLSFVTENIKPPCMSIIKPESGYMLQFEIKSPCALPRILCA